MEINVHHRATSISIPIIHSKTPDECIAIVKKILDVIDERENSKPKREIPGPNND